MSSNATLRVSSAASTRIASRQSRTRERILAESTRLFLAQGFETVSVDSIVGTADVARSSFYRFFANREEVLSSITRPVFESGIAMLDALEGRPPREIMDGIFGAYLRLWSAGPEVLLLTMRVGSSHFRLFEDLHRAFRERLTSLTRLVEPTGLLLNGSGENTARIIARTAVPVLEVYRNDPRTEVLFRKTMSGMLIKPEA